MTRSRLEECARRAVHDLPRTAPDAVRHIVDHGGYRDAAAVEFLVQRVLGNRAIIEARASQLAHRGYWPDAALFTATQEFLRLACAAHVGTSRAHYLWRLGSVLQVWRSRGFDQALRHALKQDEGVGSGLVAAATIVFLLLIGSAALGAVASVGGSESRHRIRPEPMAATGVGSFAPPPSTSPTRAPVADSRPVLIQTRNGGRCNLRAGPYPNAVVLDQVASGQTCLDRSSTSAPWHDVSCPGHAAGYVSATCLRGSIQAAAPMSTPRTHAPRMSTPRMSTPRWSAPARSGRCCRVCRRGYACGNSCISRSRRCHQPPGCACDAY